MINLTYFYHKQKIDFLAWLNSMLLEGNVFGHNIVINLQCFSLQVPLYAETRNDLPYEVFM